MVAKRVEDVEFGGVVEGHMVVITTKGVDGLGSD